LEREEALRAVRSRVKNDRLVKHMLAVEAIMRAIARKFGEDEDAWALAGLVHDIDYDETAKDPERHGLLGGSYLRELGVDEQVVHAVESHAGHRNRDSRMDKALYAIDPLSGLLVAAALMHPSKQIGALDSEFVLNRFKEKRFAAGANREQIKGCEEMGIDLAEFVDVALRAMQAISTDLGL
jgi:putative nucleotidyltransferase with HDIG domain